MEMNKSLRAFFEAYAEANNKHNLEPLAAMYADSFIAAGPGGNAVFKNDAQFIKWLQELLQWNLQMGMQQIRIVRFAEAPVSDQYRQAIVTWGAKFEKTCNEEILFDITYYVYLQQDAPRIIMYIAHTDQDALMREKGLLP